MTFVLSWSILELINSQFSKIKTSKIEEIKPQKIHLFDFLFWILDLIYFIYLNFDFNFNLFHFLHWTTHHYSWLLNEFHHLLVPLSLPFHSSPSHFLFTNTRLRRSLQLLGTTTLLVVRFRFTNMGIFAIIRIAFLFLSINSFHTHTFQWIFPGCHQQNCFVLQCSYHAGCRVLRYRNLFRKRHRSQIRQ